MRIQRNIAWLPLLSILAMSGCVTTGSQRTETVVTDMHQRVSILDRDLGTSLTELNENTAALIARVNENERQVRLLQSLMQENQHKIDNLLKMLDNLKRVLYRHWGLDPGPPLVIGDSATSIRRPERSTTQSSVVIEDAPVAGPPPEASAPLIVGDQEAYAEAKNFYDSENYERAVDAFTEFIQRFSSSEYRHQAQFWVGKSYLNQGEYSKAIQAFETVRRDYPDSSYMAFALHNQAVAHFRLGERDTAIALMEEVVANYPTSTAADHARRDLGQLRSR